MSCTIYYGILLFVLLLFPVNNIYSVFFIQRQIYIKRIRELLNFKHLGIPFLIVSV